MLLFMQFNCVIKSLCGINAQSIYFRFCQLLYLLAKEFDLCRV